MKSESATDLAEATTRPFERSTDPREDAAKVRQSETRQREAGTRWEGRAPANQLLSSDLRHAPSPSTTLPPGGLFATFQQTRRFHLCRPVREGRRHAAPAQRLHLLEERRIGPQRREIFEE